MPDAEGHQVAGRYRLVEQVGAGGMAAVWRATDEQLGRDVALKRGYATDHSGQRAALREARIVAGLDHPHVVTLHDVVTDDGLWLVMEYLPARSLGDARRDGPLPPRRAAEIGAQVGSALAELHRNGVLHRDVKPDNILLAPGGAKLTDFGISRTAWADPTVTGDGLVAGTPRYLAPEVANGEPPSEASDVFSLGATLYAAVEGESPYGPSDNPLLLLRRAAEYQVTPPRRAGALGDVLLRVMRRDPAERPDAAEATALLRQAAEAGTTPAGSAPGRRGAPGTTPVTVVTRWVTVPRVAVLVLAVGLLLPGSVAADPDRPDAGTAPASALGDPRTADPCPLADPEGLARFGETDLDTDYGNFDRCDVVVQPSAGGEYDVEVSFDNKLEPGETPEGTRRKHGSVQVFRTTEHDDACERTLLLADRHQVWVTAKRFDDGPADLCAMAEVATRHAVRLINANGTVPRRPEPFPAASTANLDACGLLDSEALSAVPGVDAAEPDVGYGNWSCRWYSTTTELSVDLRFDRDQPLTPEDGTPAVFSGHRGFVQPEGDGDHTCMIRTVHRPYSDPNGHRAVELVQLVLAGPGSARQLCALGSRLAEAAADKLPAA